MIGILIVTHQELAEALLSVWDLILGTAGGHRGRVPGPQRAP